MSRRSIALAIPDDERALYAYYMATTRSDAAAFRGARKSGWDDRIWSTLNALRAGKTKQGKPLYRLADGALYTFERTRQSEAELLRRPLEEIGGVGFTRALASDLPAAARKSPRRDARARTRSPSTSRRSARRSPLRGSRCSRRR